MWGLRMVEGGHMLMKVCRELVETPLGLVA